MAEKKKYDELFSENALTVLKKRYFNKNEKGEVIEDVESMFRRVSDNIAEVEKIYDKEADIKKVSDDFFDLMISKDFMPNSPTLMNAGNYLQQLSACFVLPVEDSIEGIFEAVKNTALIHKSGGGTGFSFSRIRPKNDTVRSTKGVSSGPVSFMHVFDAATEAIKQGGTRRGANMGILRIDHPDIEDFIRAKEKGNSKRLTNFNISVAITDAFMEALNNDGDYDIIHPVSKKVVGRKSAKKIFDLIVQKAWETGDPGIIFIDRVNEYNPTPHIGEIESTNPCGEQPLLPFEACNLGSINLLNMLKKVNDKYEVDWNQLENVTKRAIHFLDNVIDVSKFPLKEITEMVKGNRKVGLGVMGFAEMLFKLEIPYDSEEAISLGEKIMKKIDVSSKEESERLAKLRGPFPNFKGSIYDKKGLKPLRNASTTTIAPTGTISIIAGCSSGIEPLFALAFTRNILDGEQLIEVNPVFKEIAVKEGFYSDKLMRKISDAGSLHDINEIPEKWKKIFKTAHDISPEWHIKMQAAFQKYTDNAVSKTINFAHETKPEEVKKSYLLAYKLGCKGVTVFRDRCLEAQVLDIGVSKDKTDVVSEERGTISPRERSSVMKGVTRRFRTGCGNIYITLNYDNRGLFEIFTQIGKAGGCAASQAEAIGRLSSLSLRSGIDAKYVVEQLKGIRCHRPSWDNGKKILSCADAIGNAIEEFLENEYLKEEDAITNFQVKFDMAKNAGSKEEIMHIGACPECGAALEINEGCLTCRVCGYSECS